VWREVTEARENKNHTEEVVSLSGERAADRGVVGGR